METLSISLCIPALFVPTTGWCRCVSGFIVFAGSLAISCILGFIWYWPGNVVMIIVRSALEERLRLPWLFMLIIQLFMLDPFVSIDDCSIRPSSSCFIIEVEGNRVLCWKSLTIVVCWIEARKLCCCSCCWAASGTLWRIWNKFQITVCPGNFPYRRLTFLWPST